MNPEKTADKIRRRLTAVFAPILLEVVDESALHAGHSGARALGKTSETHFRVTLVSDTFIGLTKVARHRAVYAALAEEMQPDGIHALALHLASPDEKNE